MTENNNNKTKKRKWLKVKAMLVITSNTLPGQWEDECQLQTPTLNVRQFHPPSKEANEASALDFTVSLMVESAFE
jgi:hypothetical protein